VKSLDLATVRLSTTITVAKYRQLERDHDKHRIAQFLRARFAERYLRPAQGSPSSKNGFAMMAIACLMIEALESFRLGWPDSRGRSQNAFRFFFREWPRFAVFTSHADDFYRGVRNGILHQAETTGGWRIQRRGPLFDADAKTLNAALFLRKLEASLDDYCNQLHDAPWDSEIWRNFRNKMSAICANTLA